MKKVFASLLALGLLSGGLAGCSGNSGDVDTSALNPVVKEGFGVAPVFEKATGDAPTELQKNVMVEGTGKECGPDSTVLANYEGQTWEGTKFDSTWDVMFGHNTPAAFSLNGVIQGWKEGLSGVTVGSRVHLVIPPDLGYGDQQMGEHIAPNSTLVFVVDVLDCSGDLNDRSALKEAQESQPLPEGITVSGELGEKPEITIAPGTPEPTEEKLIVLYEGQGDPLGPDDFAIYFGTESSWDGSAVTGSDYDREAATVSPQRVDKNKFFLGQKIGTRLLVLIPARPANEETGVPAQPAGAAVIDFTGALSPQTAESK